MAQNSIRLDASSSGVATGTSPLAWSHPVSAVNGNRLLVVGVMVGATTSPNCSGVTYAGNAMTLIGSVRTNGTVQTSLWFILAPATGSNNVSVTFSGVTNLKCHAGAVSYYNVQQSGQPDAIAGNTGSTSVATLSVTTVSDNAWVMGVAGTNGATSPVAALTTRVTLTTATTTGHGNIQDNNGPKTPAGAITVNWTGTLNAWGAQAASFVPDNTLLPNVTDSTAVSDTVTTPVITRTPLSFPAIIPDAISNSGVFRTTASWSHTIGSGLNQILIVTATCSFGQSGLTPVITATYNSVAMTKIRQDDDAGNTTSIAFFYMLAPPAGAHTIAVTNSQDPVGADASVAGAISLNNIDQTNPVDVQNTQSNSSTQTQISLNLTTVPNAWILDTGLTIGTFAVSSPDGGQIQRWQILQPLSAGGSTFASTKGPVTGLNTMLWNGSSGVTEDGNLTAVSFAPNVVGDSTAVSETVSLTLSSAPPTAAVTDSTAVSDTPTVVIKSFINVADSSATYDTITNFIANPSFEVDLVNWSTYANGGDFTSTLTRDTTTSFIGTASMKIVGGGTSGSFFGSSVAMSGLIVGQTYTLSVYAKGNAGGEQLNLYPNTVGQQTFSLTTSFARYSITFVAATTNPSLYIRCSTTAATFWVDAIQLEYGSSATTYVDGAQTGASWTGTANNSASVTANTVVNVNRVSFPSVSESSAVSDTPTIVEVYLVNKTDSSAVAEVVTFQVFSNLNVTDSSAVSDTPIIEIFSFPNKSDSTAVSDTPIVQVLYPISVIDSSAVSETVNLEIFSNVAVTDSTATSDTPIVTSNSFINVTDSTAVSESITIAPGGPRISVSDTTIVTDSFSPQEEISYLNILSPIRQGVKII